MILVVADAELLLDNLGDAGAGPDLTPEAVSLRPVPEEALVSSASAPPSVDSRGQELSANEVHSGHLVQQRQATG